MEQSNSSYIKAQEELKGVRNRHEAENKLGERFIQKVIEKSIELKNSILTIDEKRSSMYGKKSSHFSQSQMGEIMTDLELSIAKLQDVKDEKGGVLSELRDHLIEIYNKVGVGLLRRHLYYEEQLKKQEMEWSATCDKLIEDHQNMKEESKI